MWLKDEPRVSFEKLSEFDKNHLLSLMWDALRAAHTVNLDSIHYCILGISLQKPNIRTYLQVILDSSGDLRTLVNSRFLTTAEIFQETELSSFLFSGRTTRERLQYRTHKRLALSRLLYIGYWLYKGINVGELLQSHSHIRQCMLDDTEFNVWAEPILDAACKK